MRFYGLPCEHIQVYVRFAQGLLVQFSACRVGNQMYILGNALLLKILKSQLFSLLNASNHSRKSGAEHYRTCTQAACLQTLTRSRGQGAVLLT